MRIPLERENEVIGPCNGALRCYWAVTGEIDVIPITC